MFADVWRQSVWCYGMDYSSFRSTVDIWWSQWIAFHIWKASKGCFGLFPSNISSTLCGSNISQVTFQLKSTEMTLASQTFIEYMVALQTWLLYKHGQNWS